MKNTIENKARFFGNYLGATICYPEIDNKITKAKLTSVGFEEIQTTYFRKRKSANNTHCVGDILAWKSNGNHKCNALNAYLELTPLSAITDEHAKWIIEKENFIGLFEDVVLSEDFLNYLIGIKNGKCNKYEVIDYIRKKGYALPFEDISVDEQIEFGWIKLK